MQSSSLKLQYIIAFLFILVIIILTYDISKQAKNLKHINDFLSNTQNLLYLDKNIDANLKIMNFHKQYDDIENLILNFDNELSKMKSIVEKYDQQKKLFDKIQNDFLDQKEKIRYYNGKMALIYSSMLDMQKYTEKNKISSVLSSIYSRFLNLDFDLHADIENFLDYLSSVNTTQLSKIEFKFVNKIYEAITNLHKANEYKIYILNNDLKLNLTKFLDHIKKQHKNLINKIINIFIIMIVISLMFIVWNVRLLNKIKSRDKDIRFLKIAANNSYNSIIFTDEKLNIVYVNEAFEHINGYKIKDIMGNNPSFLKYYTKDDKYYDELRKALKRKIPWSKEYFESKKSDNTKIIENISIIPNINEGKLEGFVSIKLDKTKEQNAKIELKSKNEALKKQIYKDHLTDTGSYTALMEKLDKNEDGIIIYIRINNFLNLSYFYKSKIIDEFIVSFVNTLKLCITTYNIECELFRFQLDEFCIFYRGKNLSQDISHIKSYFQTKFINLAHIENTKTNVQKIELILGVSSNMDSNITRLTQAIWAYEEAKKSDEKIYFYQDNDPMEQQYFKNLDIIKLIQNALKNDKVIVECQPIFNIKTNNKKANKYEILIRILDDDGKIHYPGEFLDVAKQILLYNALTNKVINITFDLLEKYPNKQFSINLSSSDMSNSNIRKIFIEKLKICRNPTNLYVEILESESIDNYDTILPFIKEIKSLGCKLSIDDFGSGYSNYYRMLEFDVDVLKIDGSIIKLLPKDKNAKVVMETIVNFAKKMNYEIVAEFISDKNILNEVKKYDVDYGQGFYLGKPIYPDFIIFD